jgi:hypothetical protein
MNQANHRPPLAKRAMNALLWTTQVLWGAFFSITSFGKVLCYEPALWNNRSMKGLGFPQCRRTCSSSSTVSFFESSA